MLLLILGVGGGEKQRKKEMPLHARVCVGVLCSEHWSHPLAWLLPWAVFHTVHSGLPPELLLSPL